MKTKVFSVLVGVAIFVPQTVLAQTVPLFPVCSNPQGTVVASYGSGNHAVVGDPQIKQGSDKVYALDGNNKLMQCLCTSDGKGIQTNWWKIGSLSQDDVQTFIKLGWHFVPDGAAWGLDSEPYLAQNSAYLCSYEYGGPPECKADKPEAPVVTSVVKSGTTATLTWTAVEKATHYTISYGVAGSGEYPYGVPNTGNQTSYTINELDPNKNYDFIVYAVNDCMPSNSSTRGSGGGQVLGLATTGSSLTTLTTFVGGLLLILIGRKLKKAYN